MYSGSNKKLWKDAIVSGQLGNSFILFYYVLFIIII